MVETRVSLIERVRDASDDVAWDEFFSIYQPLLTAYVRKRGVIESDAADIVQDVFARLVPALGTFHLDTERGRFRTWLWRVTHNALVDWSRKRATRDRAEQGWADQFDASNDDRLTVEWDQLYRQRILQIAIERVKASSQSLTWACFEGRVLAERPAAEVAAQLGVSTNAVYVNSSRVMARLREELGTFEEPLASP